MSDVEVTLGSVEYLYADVTSNLTLDTQPVEMAYATTIDSVSAWETATWEGAAATARTAKALFTFDAVGTFTVFVRITDNPEVPIVEAGKLKVTVR